MTPRLTLAAVAQIVDDPYEGVSKKTGRRFANVPAGGFLGSRLVNFQIALPENLSIEPFKLGDTWLFPLAMIEADDKRNVYFKLRGDAEAMRMMRKLTPAEAAALMGLTPVDDAHDEDGVLG